MLTPKEILFGKLYIFRLGNFQKLWLCKYLCATGILTRFSLFAMVKDRMFPIMFQANYLPTLPVLRNVYAFVGLDYVSYSLFILNKLYTVSFMFYTIYSITKK